MNAEPPPAVGSIEPHRVLPSHTSRSKSTAPKGDLGDCLVTDARAQDRDIHLQEEVAER